MNRCPLTVTIVAWIYIVAGVIGFAYHAANFGVPIAYDFVWVELLRLTAVVCGVYMLRGRNWARWLALAWISYHVVLSGFHSWFELAAHTLLCATFAYFLFRPPATRYFRSAGT